MWGGETLKERSQRSEPSMDILRFCGREKWYKKKKFKCDEDEKFKRKRIVCTERDPTLTDKHVRFFVCVFRSRRGGWLLVVSNRTLVVHRVVRPYPMTNFHCLIVSLLIQLSTVLLLLCPPLDAHSGLPFLVCFRLAALLELSVSQGDRFLALLFVLFLFGKPGPLPHRFDGLVPV